MMRWAPEAGTLVVVVDRATGAVSTITAPGRFVTAVAEAFDDGDGFVVDVSAHRDARVLQTATDVVDGTLTASAVGSLERWHVSASGEVSVTRLAPMEMPMAGTDGTVFGLTVNAAGGFIGVPVVIDPATRAVRWARYGSDEFAAQPAPAGPWLLCPTLVGSDPPRTELRVLDATDLQAPPWATWTLPWVVPLGTRALWTPTLPDPPPRTRDG